MNKPPALSLIRLFQLAPKNPLDLFCKAAEIGDIVRMPSLKPTLLINDPAAVAHVLQSHHGNYDKGDREYGRLRAILGSGLLTNPNNSDWQKCRKLLQPNFHLKQLTQTVSTIADMTNRTITDWQSQHHDQPFDAIKPIMALVLRISTQLMFGIDLADQAPKVIDAVRIGNAYGAQSPSLATWMPSIQNVRYRKHKCASERMMNDIIDNYQPNANNLLDPLFLQYRAGDISRDQLLGEMRNFLIAGHETVGDTLVWCLSELAQHPDLLTTLQTHVRNHPKSGQWDFDALQTLPLMEKALQETLRLYPPIWMKGREVLADDEIEGYPVRAGSSVIVCIYTLHRHPKYWENPSQFDPERFTPARSKGRPKCAYIPFGIGPRVCIGKQLAMMMAKTILATLLERVNVEFPYNAQLTPLPLITLKPQGSLPIRLTMP